MNSQIDARQREYTELRAAVSSARDLYTNGYANYLEFISAQQGLLDAEIAITLIRKNQLQNLVNLYRSLGGGWN
jgi:outer membrane protein TolC